MTTVSRRNSSSSLLTVNRLLEPKEGYKSPFKDSTGPTVLSRNTSSTKLRRRHTIQEGARSLSNGAVRQTYVEDPKDEKEKPKDNMDCVAIKLALKYRLMLSEVKNIIREFLEAKRDAEGGIGRAEFDKVMARIFDVPSVKEHVCQTAFEACVAPDGINIEEFLAWYVQNMFTQVNGLNADVGKRESETLVYELSSKFKVPVAMVDRMKKKFDNFDLDHNGHLDFDEFLKMFSELMRVAEVNPDRVKKFWDQIEKSKSVVTFEEFVRWHAQHHSDDSWSLNDEFDPAAPLRKFYDAYDPVVQRRNSFKSMMSRGHTVHT